MIVASVAVSNKAWVKMAPYPAGLLLAVPSPSPVSVIVMYLMWTHFSWGHVKCRLISLIKDVDNRFGCPDDPGSTSFHFKPGLFLHFPIIGLHFKLECVFMVTIIIFFKRILSFFGYGIIWRVEDIVDCLASIVKQQCLMSCLVCNV